jgi:hypothetical protein
MVLKVLAFFGVIFLLWLLRKFIGWVHRNDPVHKCVVYRTEGCAHVDGILCSYPVCGILDGYLEKKQKEKDVEQTWL